MEQDENKLGAAKNVAFDTDLLTKYDWIIKYWPANTIDIIVTRLTGIAVQRVITSRPTSGTALFAELKKLHGEHEEAEYEVKFVDADTRHFHGMGRIGLPSGAAPPLSTPVSKTYDGMRADIREHEPLREDVRSGLTTLLVQARQIWGDDEDDRHTFQEIVVRLMVGVGDLARAARDGGYYVDPPPPVNLGTAEQIERRWTGVKKELGNVLFSTIRWIDDLGLDPLECLDLAIESQEEFAKSDRPR